jgi:EAL domain-containing protein (putative c-di-GMP-specific phosphodiesterase class I)
MAHGGTGRGCTAEMRPGLASAADDLGRALDGGQLQIRHQPIVSLVDGRVAAVEAQVHWDHPDLGSVSPNALLAQADDALVRRLGRWVLGTAVEAAADRIGRHADGAPVPVRVDVTARQLDDPDLGAYVGVLLRTHGLPTPLLQLEVAASVLGDLSEIGRRQLDLLTDLGVGLVVDDLGSAATSIADLRRLRAAGVNLDARLVHAAAAEPADSAIVGVMLRMAESLGLTAVAVGLHQPDQLVALWGLGCVLGQGPLLSDALDDDALDARLAARHNAADVVDLLAGRSAAPGPADVHIDLRGDIPEHAGRRPQHPRLQ